MKQLSNTEVIMKKSVAYKKGVIRIIFTDTLRNSADIAEVELHAVQHIP